MSSDRRPQALRNLVAFVLAEAAAQLARREANARVGRSPFAPLRFPGLALAAALLAFCLVAVVSAPLALAGRPSGRLDPSFGIGGKVLTDFSGAGSSDTADAAAVQGDNKIVVAGTSDANGSDDFALARYNPDGSLDAGFNATGKVLTDFSGGSDDVLRAVAIQSDGKIVAAGFSNASGSNDFALARYNPDGTLDTSFGSGGKVLTDFSGAGSLDT